MRLEEPTTIAELQQAVRRNERLRCVGGGSKTALSTCHDNGRASLSLARLSDVLEYEPTEFTFTAQAGTPVCEIDAMLAEQGQFLPCDPPLVAAGATLGGTVASGLSGSLRFAYGGVRDFVLGARLVNGHGDVVYGGAKVVKNAAGFDIPKLMVGGLGQFGALAELTFKVFPCPQRYGTLRVDCKTRRGAITLLSALSGSQLELHALDYEPPHQLWLRWGGSADAWESRRAALQTEVARLAEQNKFVISQLEIVEPDTSLWQSVAELDWLGESDRLMKIPVTPPLIEPLEDLLDNLPSQGTPIPRRYTVGGNLFWIGWPSDRLTEQLEDLLQDIGRRGLAVLGAWPRPMLGPTGDDTFLTRLRNVFDPSGKFAIDDH